MVSFDRTTEALDFALEHAAELGYVEPYRGPARHLLRNGRADSQRGATRALGIATRRFPRFAARGAAPRLMPSCFDAFFAGEESSHRGARRFLSDLFRRLDPGRPCAMPTYSRSTMSEG